MIGVLLPVAFAVPLVMLAACLSPRTAAQMPDWLWVAPVPALVAALFASGSDIALPRALLGLRFALDRPGAILLGAVSLLWIAGDLYTSAWLRGRPTSGRFVAWWLLTLAGSIGVFMAADLVSFYLVFSMVSLAAYGLVIEDGTTRSRRAGLIYVFLAVLGEAFLLMAFVLLAQAIPGDSLLIGDAVAALPASPAHNVILALLILGFGAKIGMVPFHVWMPLAYRAAPIPAAAVMSGAAVKAGVIGLIRFLPWDAAQPAWGAVLIGAGLFSAYFGVAIGITQSNPKTVLAYSSVSQMGLIAVVFGVGLSAGDNTVALAAALYAAHHILVKGTLFLSVDVVQASDRRRLWPFLLPTAILALSLAGLPFTGGAVAKIAMKGVLGSGFVAGLATLSAAGSTLLMLHFLRRLAGTAIREGDAPASLVAPWAALAVACVAVPWLLYFRLGGGTLAYALSPGVLWAASWPVLLGAALAAVLVRTESRLPLVPPGDIIALAPHAGRFAGLASDALEHADVALRRWPVAGVCLLTLAIVLGFAMLAGHP